MLLLLLPLLVLFVLWKRHCTIQYSAMLACLLDCFVLFVCYIIIVIILIIILINHSDSACLFVTRCGCSVDRRGTATGTVPYHFEANSTDCSARSITVLYCIVLVSNARRQVCLLSRVCSCVRVCVFVCERAFACVRLCLRLFFPRGFSENVQVSLTKPTAKGSSLTGPQRIQNM